MNQIECPTCKGVGSITQIDPVKVMSTINTLIDQQLALRGEELGKDDHLEDDLGADSLDLLEMLMCLEEEFEIEIPDAKAEEIKTVGDAYKCILGGLCSGR